MTSPTPVPTSSERVRDPSAAIRIAVVGHTNAGKTSLLRTLTRRADFGEVSDRPGTTRHVERVELRVEGRSAGVQFFDTPGLEDAVALQEHVRSFFAGDADTLPAEQVRRFLQGPEARGVFEQEAKVLRTLLDCDAAFLVIDVRTPILPKYRAEIGLLNACARPVLPVLNFVREPGAGREAEWRALLADAGLHAVARFDATAPFTGAERELYQDLATLLPVHRQALATVVDRLEAETSARHQAAGNEIALLLVQTAAMRRTVRPPRSGAPGEPRPTNMEPGFANESASAGTVDAAITAAMRAATTRLQQDVLKRAQRCSDTLLQLHGFRQGDTAEAPLPALHGRWDMDLFSPDTLRQAGTRLGAGAAVGAAVGLVADIALAGTSLGAGMAMGGALGGALAHGWGPLGRRMANRLRGIREVTVEDAVLAILARRQLALLRALERRGHADASPIAGEDSDEVGMMQTDDAAHEIGTPRMTQAAGTRPLAEPQDRGQIEAAVRATRSARSHPKWEGRKTAQDSELAEVVAAVAWVLCRTE
jgi:hypothetical protein